MDVNYTIEPTHISQIRIGDTVEVNGMLKTVCRGDFGNGFMGLTLFGDSYRMGTKPVSKAIVESVK